MRRIENVALLRAKPRLVGGEERYEVKWWIAD
jgi:hypothetical protein